MPYELRVLIDGRPLVPPRSGIGVHTAEIARRLDVSPPPLIASHTQIVNKEGLEHCRFRVDRAPNGILWQQFVLPRITDADVLWGPHGTMPVASRLPCVVTLHDFSSITMPGAHLFRTIVSFDLFITRSLDRARRIAAVSRAIAEEAVRWFGVRRSAIEIVPNGVDEFFAPGGSEGDYILFVGTLEPRKGIDDLLAVWGSLPEPRPRLILCGDAGWRVRLEVLAPLASTGGRIRLRVSVALRRIRDPAAGSHGVRRAGDRHAHGRHSRVRRGSGAPDRARRSQRAARRAGPSPAR